MTMVIPAQDGALITHMRPVASPDQCAAMRRAGGVL